MLFLYLSLFSHVEICNVFDDFPGGIFTPFWELLGAITSIWSVSFSDVFLMLFFFVFL